MQFLNLLKQTKRTVCHFAVKEKRKFSEAKSHKVFRLCDFSLVEMKKQKNQLNT